MKKSTSTTFQLFVSGLLMVNLPIVIVMLSCVAIIRSYSSLKISEAAIISLIFGWTYWEFSSRLWIKWALKRNVEKDRLHKIGLRSLILWPSDKKKIEKIAAQLSNEDNL